MRFSNGPTRPIGRGDPGEPPDEQRVLAFLRQQTRALRRGLARADDARERAGALAVHDAAHGRWLEAIAWARRQGRPGFAELMTDGYVLHGRIARHLERADGVALAEVTVQAVRGVLSGELDVAYARCAQACGRFGPSASSGRAGTR